MLKCNKIQGVQMLLIVEIYNSGDIKNDSEVS